VDEPAAKRGWSLRRVHGQHCRTASTITVAGSSSPAKRTRAGWPASGTLAPRACFPGGTC